MVTSDQHTPDLPSCGVLFRVRLRLVSMPETVFIHVLTDEILYLYGSQSYKAEEWQNQDNCNMNMVELCTSPANSCILFLCSRSVSNDSHGDDH